MRGALEVRIWVTLKKLSSSVWLDPQSASQVHIGAIIGVGQGSEARVQQGLFVPLGVDGRWQSHNISMSPTKPNPACLQRASGEKTRRVANLQNIHTDRYIHCRRHKDLPSLGTKRHGSFPSSSGSQWHSESSVLFIIEPKKAQ